MDIKGTSWQERYQAAEVFTLRCMILDKPGMLARLLRAIGQVGVNIGNITTVGIKGDRKIRDITIFCANKERLKAAVEAVQGAEGIAVLEVRDDILEIHRRGAIDVVSRTPIKTLTDLRMVYTPGVASVCKKVEAEPVSAWDYTGICDRVAIVTNGTAVLGLGDIGVLASLPVMEGKAAIYAEFAGVSAFPVLIDSKDVDTIVKTVVLTASAFGAIQLEDIAAPACFEIEQKLIQQLDIPVLHDDQHATSTVVLAALINALKQTQKKPEECSTLILGAGAAGYAIAKTLLNFGIGDVVVYDSTGAIYRGRTEKMNPYKQELADITNKKNQSCPLAEGFSGKDIFIGVSQPHTVSKNMIATMAKDPIVFPLSNPVGEISTEEAQEAGAAVTADGRGINNAQAYPGLFRGALDARAKEINPDMRLAASRKLAELAPQGHLLPDMLDKSIHQQVAQAVASCYTKKQDNNR